MAAADQHLSATLDEAPHFGSVLGDPVLHVGAAGHAGEGGRETGQSPISHVQCQFVLVEEIRCRIASTPIEMNRAVAGVVTNETDQRADPRAGTDQD